MLTPSRLTRNLPAEAARWSTTTQIYEGTNQIQRNEIGMMMIKEAASQQQEAVLV